MPDFASAGDLFRSRILGMGLEDTPYPQQAVAGMLGGATPEQLHAFFGSQPVQEQFKAFGIDPQQFTQNIRQSPFLPNAAMQQHPMLGGALTRAMAAGAATPEAPLVSGAGSGISRAMQGMYGGPELVRQYQLHQMMAPFGMMAGMMPTYGEERRRAIEQAIVEETKKRMEQIPAQAQLQGEISDAKRIAAEAAQAKAEAAQDAAHRPRVYFGPIGTGIETIQDVPYSPAGGAQGTDFQMGGGPGRSMTGISGPGAGQQFQAPGFGLTPEQQAGWMMQYTPYDQAAMQGQFRAKAEGTQTPEKGALIQAQTKTEGAKQGELGARGERERAQGRAAEKLAAIKGERAEDYTKFSKQYNDAQDRWAKQSQHIRELLAGGSVSKEAADTMQKAADDELATVKANIDQARRKPGESGGVTRPGVISPGASPGSAQAGGPGAQKSQGTAVAPNQTGLPPGYIFNEQGIPVPAQQQAPQQAPRP